MQQYHIRAHWIRCNTEIMMELSTVSSAAEWNLIDHINIEGLRVLWRVSSVFVSVCIAHFILSLNIRRVYGIHFVIFCVPFLISLPLMLCVCMQQSYLNDWLAKPAYGAAWNTLHTHKHMQPFLKRANGNSIKISIGGACKWTDKASKVTRPNLSSSSLRQFTVYLFLLDGRFTESCCLCSYEILSFGSPSDSCNLVEWNKLNRMININLIEGQEKREMIYKKP